MKRILPLLIFLMFVLSSHLYAGERPNVYSLLNKEISVSNNWAGESITLVKENEKYFVIRKFFGSGRPVVGEVRYKAEFRSDYQIQFTNVVKRGGLKDSSLREEFILTIIDNGNINLFLNGVEVVIIGIDNESL